MIVVLMILVLFITSLTGVYFFRNKIKKEKSMQTVESIRDILDSKAFYPTEIHFINRHLSLALNKTRTMLAIVENFNPNNPDSFDYNELSLSFIRAIEKKGSSIKMHYVKKGEERTLDIYPASNEIKEFIHKIYKNASFKKIENNFADCNFTLYCASDWNCEYIWAYDCKKGVFAYIETGAKSVISKINLRKEHFTIDLRYDYLEVPIGGVFQQLLIYDKTFLFDLYKNMLKNIKNKSSKINNDTLFYDKDNNIIYLSNGSSLVQSILLDKVEEIFYQENRAYFTLKNSAKTVSYAANGKLIRELEEFIINYNLNNIAKNFDHKSDKLINTTKNTKCIIDFSRDRIIYCANLNKIKAFSFLYIAFYDLEEVEIKKSGLVNFVRITKNDKETIDITCDKAEIACYIEAQLKRIMTQ